MAMTRSLPERIVAPRTALHSRRYTDDGDVVGHEPDEVYLNALLQQGWAEQQPQRELDDKIEMMLDDRHDLALPDVGIESEEVRGGWGMELVQRIKQFWPNPPTIRIPSMGAGDEPEHFANDLESALNALISVQGKAKRGPGGTFYDTLKEQVVAFGRGYAALLPDRRAYTGYPVPTPEEGQKAIKDPALAKQYLQEVEKYSKGRLPPLALRSLAPRRVIPFFDDDGLAEVFWFTSERAWEVMARAKARGVTANRTLQWVEEDFDQRAAMNVVVAHYANRSWCAELVGSPTAFPPSTDNPNWKTDTDLLGAPYRHWLTNRVPVAYFPGMTTPLSSRHKRTVSVIYQLRNIITMLDRLASMKSTAVRVWAWPTPVLKASMVNAQLLAEGDDGRPRPVEIQPGMVVTIWGDEELSFLTWQGNGPDQNEMLSLLQKQFERLGLPIVEAGQGDLSGYAIAQLRSAARGKWSSIEKGLAQGWEDLAWLELEYLKQMPGTIWVPTVAEAGWAGAGAFADARTSERSAYLRLKPQTLRDRTFLMEVTVEPDKSLDLVANAQAAQGMAALGVPKRIIFEDVLGLRNYSQIRLMKMLEDLEETPEYKQTIFGAALQQGRLLLEKQGPTGEGGGLTPGQLTQYSPGMIQAMVQAGVVDPQTAQQVLQQQQGNIPPGQAVGALTNGGLPPTVQGGPFPAPGGAPGMTPLQGGPESAMPPGAMTTLGALGGAPSPVTMTPQAAPRLLPGRGRAAGQSREPARRGPP